MLSPPRSCGTSCLRRDLIHRLQRLGSVHHRGAGAHIHRHGQGLRHCRARGPLLDRALGVIRGMQGEQRVATAIASATSSLVLPSSASPPCAARAILEKVFITFGAAYRRPIFARQAKPLRGLLLQSLARELRSWRALDPVEPSFTKDHNVVEVVTQHLKEIGNGDA